MALGCAIGFNTMSHRSGFAVLYPAIVEDRGWSVGEVTAAFSMAMLLYAVVAVGSGWLVDRLGVKHTMVLGTVLLGGGLAAVGLVQELWQLYLVYCIAVGIGSSAVGFVPMLKLLSLRAWTKLGLALGLFSVGQGLGALLVSPLVQVVISMNGWRSGAMMLGLIVFGVLLPLVLLGAPGRVESRGKQLPTSAPSATSLWRQPVFWLVMVANACIGYLMLLPAHRVAHFIVSGMPDVLAATAGGLMGAFIGVGALAGGWCVDRWGLGRLGLVGASLLTLGVLAMLAVTPPMLWLAAVFVLAGGVGRGMIGVNTAAFQARAFAGPTLGRVTGVLDLGFGFGAFAGPRLVAFLFDETASYVPGLMTAIPASMLAASSIMVAVRRSFRHKSVDR